MGHCYLSGKSIVSQIGSWLIQATPPKANPRKGHFVNNDNDTLS
jgi:hypothetical protein